MVSFYGNIKNSNRICLLFDKVYKSRKEMEDNMTTDGVYNGRYVLVKYGTDGKKFIPNDDATSVIIDPEYENSFNIDWNKYAQTFDATVWQKIWSANEESYIMVAELNAQPPRFELIPDAPETDDGNPHIDEYHSTIDNYLVHMPQNWKLNNEVTFDYNVKGFDKSKRSVDTTLSGINGDFNVDNPIDAFNFYLIEEESGTAYPVHETYIEYPYVNENNYTHFYIEDTESESGYRLATEDDGYSSEITYYKYAIERGIYDENGELIKEVQKDRKRFVLDMPAIGNVMSALWDLIYPLADPEYDLVESDLPGTYEENDNIVPDNFDELKDKLFVKIDDEYILLPEEAEYDENIIYYSYIPHEDGYITEEKFNDNKDTLFTKDGDNFVPVGEDGIWDPDTQYYGVANENARDTVIENRDGSVSIPDDTLADIINDLLELFGLDTDNEFEKMSGEGDDDWYPRTIWGLFNAFSDLLGYPGDSVDDDHYIPVSDEGWDTYGVTSPSNYILWNNNGFGPLYEKNADGEFIPSGEYTPEQGFLPFGTNITEFQNALLNGVPIYTLIDGEYVQKDVPSFEGLNNFQQQEIIDDLTDEFNTNPNQFYEYVYTQYYRDTNTMWGLLNLYKQERKNYRPDWTEDYANSLKFIEHKPLVVFQTDAAITDFEVENYSLISDDNYYKLVYSDNNREQGYISLDYFNANKDLLFIKQTVEDIDEYVSAADLLYDANEQYYYTGLLSHEINNASIESRWNQVSINPNGHYIVTTGAETEFDGFSEITLADLESIIASI